MAIEFDLLANAKDSLAHAVSHLVGVGDASSNRWKIAVREVAHVIELLLKERLSRLHPSLLWVNVDKFPSLDAPTIGAEQAVNRLTWICGIKLSPETRDTIETCRRLRNKMEHYSFQLDEKEARGIIGRMLSTIFSFSRKHLQLDLEGEFKKDTTWKELVQMHEFWEAHGQTLSRQLSEDKIPTEDCPSCAAATFNAKTERCELCGHIDELVECEQCQNSVWASETEIVQIDEFGDNSTFCQGCIERLF